MIFWKRSDSYNKRNSRGCRGPQNDAVRKIKFLIMTLDDRNKTNHSVLKNMFKTII